MKTRLMFSVIIASFLYEYAKTLSCNSTQLPSIHFCRSGNITDSNIIFISGSNMNSKKQLNRGECTCQVTQSSNRDIEVDGMDSCTLCGLRVQVGDVAFRSNVQGLKHKIWGNIILNENKFTISMRTEGKRIDMDSGICIQITGMNLTLTCESLGKIKTTQNRPLASTKKNVLMVTRIPLLKTKTNISVMETDHTRMDVRSNTFAVAGAGFGVGVVLVIVVVFGIFIVSYIKKKRNKDKERSSASPPPLYNELQSRSRNGQTDSHVYATISRPNTYVNDVYI